jgi:hypothetical protein
MKHKGNMHWGFDGVEDKNKYRIYLDDRLLMERFFPADMSASQTYFEHFVLDSPVTGTISIPNELGLIIDKIEIDGLTVTVNDITYDLLLS